MKIIFHGGLPKTGTTSIQSFLKRQPNDIDGRIIYYPKGFRNNGAHHLQIAEALGCHPNFTQDLGILNYHRQTIREFASCAAEHKSAALVLSCEVFSMNPCGAKFGDLLAKGLNYLFGDLAPNVTYLFYVREPVSWSISMYNQLVRSGRISVSPLVYASNISERPMFIRYLPL